MKSGPTLKPATVWPRAANAAISPVATVVLPTPEWVPATTSRGSPDPLGLALVAITHSPLDPLLAADALLVGVLKLAHLGDQVGGVDQLGGRVTAGDHHMLEAGSVPQGGDHLSGVDPAEGHRVRQLVEDQQLIGLGGKAALYFFPALAGEVGGLVEVA